TGETNEIGVLAVGTCNPQISSQQIKHESTISKRNVLRIFARYFHPYHIGLHKDLHGTDFMNPAVFCQRAQHETQMNATFSSSILFIDETTFTNHGNLNLHDTQY
ncbi:hypothetical protein WH47_12480, partial [Habropoda laboriosa]